jgi:hypothetical protein
VDDEGDSEGAVSGSGDLDSDGVVLATGVVETATAVVLMDAPGVEFSEGDDDVPCSRLGDGDGDGEGSGDELDDALDDELDDELGEGDGEVSILDVVDVEKTVTKFV